MPAPDGMAPDPRWKVQSPSELLLLHVVSAFHCGCPSLIRFLVVREQGPLRGIFCRF